MRLITNALLFQLFIMILFGCKSKEQAQKEVSIEEGRLLDSFVKGIMHRYTAYYSKRKVDPRLPTDWRPEYLYTVGATYKGDTIRILQKGLWDLIELCEETGAPIDSLSLAGLVKTEKLLKLNKNAMDGVFIVRKWKSVDSVATAGKQEFLNYYFNDDGFLKGKNTTSKENIYIIDRLSDWGVLIAQDDISGYYYIEKHFPNDAIE